MEKESYIQGFANDKSLEERLKRREELGKVFIFDHNFYRETIFAALKDEEEYKPFVRLQFFILTKDNSLKLANKIVDILTFGIADIHGEMIQFCYDNNYRLVGVGSKKYGISYFQKQLDDKGIAYQFEHDNEGNAKIFI